MAVLIFANGVIEDVGWIRPYFAEKTAVVAANGGSRHLHALGEAPDVLIGDMDSLNRDLVRWLEKTNCRVIASPAEKDETDLELALLYAAETYAAEMLLFGTLGGRLDQTLGNILLLTHPNLAHRPIKLLTERETAWLVREEGTINGQVGDTVSLIPLGGDVFVESTLGLKYPLQKETLSFGPARGISNTMIDREAAVRIRSGLLLCIHTAKPFAI